LAAFSAPKEKTKVEAQENMRKASYPKHRQSGKAII
jgi:hypothetical protein